MYPPENQVKEHAHDAKEIRSKEFEHEKNVLCSYFQSCIIKSVSISLFMSTSLNVASIFHLINLQLLHMTRATTHSVGVVHQNLAGFCSFHALDLLAPYA